VETVSGAILSQWRAEARQQALAAGLDPQEVDWLLHWGAGVDKLQLRLQTQVSLPRPWEEVQTLWCRRLTERRPLQYLVGETPWRQFCLQVQPGVLIPRPETEQIIDLVQEQVRLTPELAQGNWLDLGTGSGALALGLAHLLPEAQVYGLDYSAVALEVAASNARRYPPPRPIRWRRGDWWQGVLDLRGQLTGLVSNPPYIPRGELPHLQREVRDYEPVLALDGGEDGLESFRVLVQEAPEFLVPGGLWLAEAMAGQAPRVGQLLENQGEYRSIEIHRDLSGWERFILAWRR
jgi:release factor glutamine methyltransferase